MRIKCPICGKEDFIQVSEPIQDQYAKINGNCYVCVTCGYVAWFNIGYVKFYKDRMETIRDLESKIQEKADQISVLERRLSDTSSYKSDLASYKKELKQRVEWGEGGSKKCRALEECIAEKEAAINNGINEGVQNNINQLKNEIRELKHKKDDISHPVRLIHQV